MTEEQMIESYKKLAAKGAKNFGIHAFLASNTISDEYYPELAGIPVSYTHLWHGHEYRTAWEWTGR